MPNTRDRLRALVRGEPHLNQTELADRLGVTRQRVNQLAALEGLTLKRGPSGVAGRKAKVTESPPAAAATTGGVTSIPAGTSPTVAMFLTAADLTARGYTVFLPLTRTASCDLVAIATDGRAERVIVQKARRAGETIRFDDPPRGGYERRALILTDEPVRYEPAIVKQHNGRG